jgi:hypothetical protein
MITRTDMFAPLLNADATFQPIWEAFTEEWHGQELPLYVALSDLARHLIRALETGDVERFDAVFDVIESWQTSGDDYVREAATVGIVEDLQNTNLYKLGKPSDFERWLRPETARAWKKIEGFWSGDKVIRRE